MAVQRVFHRDKLPVEVKEGMRGGEGHCDCRGLFSQESAPSGSPFTAAGVSTLAPGSSVGVHKHSQDEEVYVIISGHGHYIDHEGAKHAVKAGDVAFCHKGEMHGLINTGNTPLTFAGIIAMRG